MIRKLREAARQRDIPLRQSYVRVGKRAAVKVSRYAHAKQLKRMRRQLRRLRTWVGPLIRDVRRARDAVLGQNDRAAGITSALVPSVVFVASITLAAPSRGSSR